MKSISLLLIVAVAGATHAGCVASTPAPAGPVIEVRGDGAGRDGDGYDGDGSTDGVAAEDGALPADANATCRGGAACNWTCPEGSCNITCAGGSSCNVDCDGGSCNLTCAGGATCNLSCSGDDCNTTCATGSTCLTD